MLLFKIVIFVLAAAMVVGTNCSVRKSRRAQTAIDGMNNYVSDLYPTTSPAVYKETYEGADTCKCDIMKTYMQIVEAERAGGVSNDIKCDIVYNSWGENEGVNGLLILVMIITVSILYCV